MGASDRLLTVAEAAILLRLSIPAVYKLIAGEVLPACRLGRSIRLSERVLQNYITAGGRAWPGPAEAGKGGPAIARTTKPSATQSGMWHAHRVTSSAPERASAPRFVQPRLARLLLSTILANVGTPFAADQRAGISRLLLIRLFQLAAVSAFRRSVVSPMVPLSPGFALQEQSGGAALNGRRPNALAHRW